MSERLESFIALSSLLTGFNEAQLWGTGVAEQHLNTLDEVLGAVLTDELLVAFQRLPVDNRLEANMSSTVLADERLGPVARNLIILWYTGTWTALPDDWRATFGASPLDTTRTTSGAAYRAGLQWVVAGGHAPGASHQGFGSWSIAPKARSA